MGAVKINGTTSGSVSLEAPATGSDVTLTLPGTTMNLGTELASKLPIAGGKILQIVRATDATQRTTTSTSFVDASLSVTITPNKNDSAVLLWAVNCVGNTSTNTYTHLAITDSSNNTISGAADMQIGDQSSTQFRTSGIIIAYATPATTTAVTYKLRFRTSVLGGTAVLDNAVNIGQLYAIEVSA